jgi:hypothetical protein
VGSKCKVEKKVKIVILAAVAAYSVDTEEYFLLYHSPVVQYHWHYGI